MAINYNADTEAIRNKLYPLVEKSLSSPKGLKEYKKVIENFISKRTESLYDTVPCDRLLCGDMDMDPLFEALNISKKEVKEIIDQTYYGTIEHFKPKAAKDPFTILQLMVIKYFIKEKDKKNLELSLIYLSFSGMFYPSIHYGSYRILPARHVMEYVVNNCLSKKYDLVSHGSVLGAIKSVASTWVDSYTNRFKKCTDEDCVYLIQQLHSRIRSFTKNIAQEYYKVYEDKDVYMAYSSDNFNSDDYHIADSDTIKVQRIVEKTMNKINASGVDYRACTQCADENITANEFRSIIQTILADRDIIVEMRELIGLMVSTYFATTSVKDVTDISFLTYTIASKPNAKQKEILRQKEIIEGWLSDKSPAYLRRRSRLATKNSYERALRMYFALAIHNANR